MTGLCCTLWNGVVFVFWDRLNKINSLFVQCFSPCLGCISLFICSSLYSPFIQWLTVTHNVKSPVILIVSIHPSIHPSSPEPQLFHLQWASPPAASVEFLNSQQKKTGQLPSVSLSVKWCFAETECVRSDDFLQVHKSLKRIFSLDSFSF